MASIAKNALQRYKLVIQYDGSRFFGYQQNPKLERLGPHLKTVQTTLEKALHRLAHKPITTVIAGRTDRGVHALMNVAHADIERVDRNTGEKREDFSCALLHTSLNHILRPQGISIRAVEKIDSRFHARFSCVRRVYHYQFASTPTFDGYPLESHARWYLNTPLDLEMMRKAAQIFVGKHDFRGFTQGESPNGTVRTIYEFEIVEDLSSPFALRPRPSVKSYTAKIAGRGFLKHQVRKMMAVIVEAGQGKLSLESIKKRLDNCETTGSGMAPPEGLCLVDVYYPEDRFTITERSAFDWESLSLDQSILTAYSKHHKALHAERASAKMERLFASKSTEQSNAPSKEE